MIVSTLLSQFQNLLPFPVGVDIPAMEVAVNYPVRAINLIVPEKTAAQIPRTNLQRKSGLIWVKDLIKRVLSAA